MIEEYKKGPLNLLNQKKNNFLVSVHSEMTKLSEKVTTVEKTPIKPIPDLKAWFNSESIINKNFNIALNSLYQSADIQTITLTPKPEQSSLVSLKEINIEVYKNDDGSFSFYQEIYYNDYLIEGIVGSISDIYSNIESIIKAPKQPNEFAQTLLQEFNETLNKDVFLYKEKLPNVPLKIFIFKDHIYSPLTLAGEKLVFLAQNLSPPHNYLSSHTVDNKNLAQWMKNLHLHQNLAGFTSTLRNDQIFFEQVRKFQVLVDSFEITKSILQSSDYNDVEISIEESEELYIDGQASIVIRKESEGLGMKTTGYISFDIAGISYDIANFEPQISQDITTQTFINLFRKYTELRKQGLDKKNLDKELKQSFPEALPN